jgi:large subunit ribosomal protein L18
MTARTSKKTLARERRHRRVRAKVSGTAARPRLSVFRSLSHVYVQIIDDAAGKTLAAASDAEVGKKKLKKSETAREVGKLLAEKAAKKGIASVVFDRGGYAYTGRIAAVADGAREGGLKF